MEQRPPSAASSVGSATSLLQSEEEEEMLSLIDQLTDQMFLQPGIPHVVKQLTAHDS